LKEFISGNIYKVKDNKFIIMKKSALIIILVAALFVMPLASAGFFDWLSLTGHSASQQEELNISVGNTGPEVRSVEAPTAAAPTELSSKTITFNVTVYDHDGFGDISPSGATANFTLAGEDDRTGTCTHLQDFNTNYANFSCSVDIMYWDKAAAYTIGVAVKDIADAYGTNLTQTFTINELKAMVIDTTTLTWDEILPSGTNLPSNNDPTTINNTGNYNVTLSGSLDVNSTDLPGETDASKVIDAVKFKVHHATGGAECSSGTSMVNITATSVSGAALDQGNLSEGGGVAQEELYYCLTEAVATLTKQAYSTDATGAWTIIMA